MVDTGNRIEQNHGCTENRAADHTNTAVVKSGSDHTEHRYDNTQGGACRMGGHVENFFSFGVIRQNTFCQFLRFNRVFTSRQCFVSTANLCRYPLIIYAPGGFVNSNVL